MEISNFAKFTAAMYFAVDNGPLRTLTLFCASFKVDIEIDVGRCMQIEVLRALL